MRSFMEPLGLDFSSLTYISRSGLGFKRWILTRGVLPIRSRIVFVFNCLHLEVVIAKQSALIKYYQNAKNNV